MDRNGWLIIVVAIVIGSSGCEEDAAQTQQQLEGNSPQTGTIGKVREPAVAGTFYPRNKDDLAEDIDRFLADVEPAPVKNLRGLICPHAGYVYSGPTAGYAYKQLEGRVVERVIVLAPSHHVAFKGASIPDVDAYRTPLGLVPLSPQAAELIKADLFVCNPLLGVGSPHTREHSLEVQLPFLQRTLEDFTIIPIVFGRVDPEAAAKALAATLDEKTILVASSDLSHFHPYDTATQLDASCISAICELDIERMEDEEACGKLPILTLMHIARKKGWKAKLLDYRNSGDVTGGKSNVVGYAAIAFFQPDDGKSAAKTPASRLTPQEGEILLELAGKTVRQVVTYGTVPAVDASDLPESLSRRRACFVTLNKGGELRGCIGSIFPDGPLCRAVIDKARNAATRDPRFPPVESKELDQLAIEVSVLTVPKRLEFKSPEDLLARLRPHVDGVVLRVGRRQATYLPQVWEKIPDREAFLSHLSQKAGLAPDAWKSPGAIVLIYQVESFKQPET